MVSRSGVAERRLSGSLVIGSRGAKLGRRKVKTSWCLGVARVTGAPEDSG